MRFVSRLAVWASLTAAAALAAEKPVFTRDVAPVLFKHCAGCHRPGEMGPMALLTYEQARPWAKAIREKVALGEMPPWHAEAAPGTFVNDRRLTAAERETLIRWADAGAPKGDPKHLPAPPVFPEGWEIGKPDAVFTMAKDYAVPESGTIPYQFFTVKTDFTEDKWIQAIEVRPGARSVVHHVLVFATAPGTEKKPLGYQQVTPKLPAGATRGPGALIATTAPGTNAMVFPAGTAIQVKAGATLMFQMHYTTNGKSAVDRTSVGMIFAKQPPQVEMRTSAFINPLFVLPAGTAGTQVDSAIEFDEDAEIHALFPHTHLRGKSWEYRLVYPGGRKEVVLSVPKYDFNWQTYYIYAKPLAAPKGSRLEASAIYDNSAANKWNPDPGKNVRWGAQTWEEMQYSGINYTLVKK